MIKKIIFILLFSIIIISCKKDEQVELPRDIAEQAAADDQILKDYLSTHFYNYEDFEDLSYNESITGGYNFLKIDTIAGENSSKIPLIGQVKKNSIRVKISNGSFVFHDLYYLVAREGIGQSPSSVDSTYLSYEGSLLNGNVFDFSDVKSKVIMVDFWASWCGPCQTMMPVLEQLKHKMGSNIRILKIDVDKNQEVAEKFKVRGVPTFVLFKSGEILWRQSGGMDINTLEKKIKASI